MSKLVYLVWLGLSMLEVGWNSRWIKKILKNKDFFCVVWCSTQQSFVLFLSIQSLTMKNFASEEIFLLLQTTQVGLWNEIEIDFSAEASKLEAMWLEQWLDDVWKYFWMAFAGPFMSANQINSADPIVVLTYLRHCVIRVLIPIAWHATFLIRDDNSETELGCPALLHSRWGFNNSFHRGMSRKSKTSLKIEPFR